MSCAAEVLPLCLSPREAGGVFFPSGVFFYLALREKGFVSLVSVMGGVLLRLLRYMVECQTAGVLGVTPTSTTYLFGACRLPCLGPRGFLVD